jgi:hypothetical protein
MINMNSPRTSYIKGDRFFRLDDLNNRLLDNMANSKLIVDVRISSSKVSNYEVIIPGSDISSARIG